ncbi:tetratricopeptide repeat protein [Flavivirga algicola]|uniref:HTH luxR-type domain-containing protein n=1 Tax=Flavivirga algicola TaxID=2729136 RepID=A0ABX1RQP9_9FLAO|nr:tetratricopeptide repeat protein [Flavivirga algicola]NMH85886.1 hypothetical protein [Flavivirga algicola]
MIVSSLSGFANTTMQDSIHNNSNQVFHEAKKIRYKNPDSALVLLKQAYNKSIISGNTTQAVESLIEAAIIHANQARYAKAYDDSWKALFLTEDIKNDSLKGTVYNNLGRLYSFYKREDQALKYLQASLEIGKSLVEKKKRKPASLVNNYHAFCSTYREFDNVEMAEKYLDSCFLYYDESLLEKNKKYLQFEKAYVLAQKKDQQEALKIMRTIEPWFLNNQPSYLVLVYTYWGDIHQALNNYKLCEKFYSKALDFSKTYNSHIDFTPLIYGKLSNLYSSKGDMDKAFNYFTIAKSLDDQFFDSRSENNRPLLEIKGVYLLEKERQERLIQKQRLEKLEQEDKIYFLQRVILIGAIVFIIVVGLIYLKNLRAKHQVEKQLIRKNKELEVRKAKELLELKNKELATSALQLIEKDEFLRDLKNKLKSEDGLNSFEINKILKSISVSNNVSWEEFRLRFTAINETFYKKITEKYPNLSQTDLKICALVKLNFSSKDMARLLSISVESVHTTRYRLRKKMGIARGENLEKFISSL